MLEKLERHPLTFGKTSIEYLPRLTERLGGKVEIYAKRENCNSGLAQGGNKLRKLEYIDACPNQLYSALTFLGGAVWRHSIRKFYWTGSPSNYVGGFCYD